MVRCDETIAVAETGPLCVAIWRGAVTTNPFEWQRAGLAETISRHPRGAGFMCVVETSAKPPDDKLRKASSEMVLSHGSRLRCLAAVIEGEGFMAAINRGAVTGMVLLAMGRKVPISVFATVRQASIWMGQYISLPPPDELTLTVEYIRSRIPPLT
jgi:hypothetical protein